MVILSESGLWAGADGYHLASLGVAARTQLLLQKVEVPEARQLDLLARLHGRFK